MELTKIFIQELQDKQNVESFFLVRDKTLGVGKSGKPFMVLILGDRSGAIDSRIWDRVDELSDAIQIGDVVKIKGAIQLFQNRKQMVIHKIERVEESPFAMETFVEASSVDTHVLFAKLLTIISTVKNPHIHQLLKDSVDDPQIKELMLKTPAARSIHHARRGGLLEHVVSICEIMDFIGKHYSFLNRDFLIFGAIFHDLGKVWEIEIEKGIHYTDRGRLLGHMEMACELIDKKSAKILGFDSELVSLLKHIVLSHHGKLEYGSPKRPKFLEAMMVAMIDELDSKVDTVHSFIMSERQSGEKWSRYNSMFDRYFLLDDLNEKYK